MYAKYKVSLLRCKMFSKMLLKLTADKQTSREDKNNMPMIIRFWDIKISALQ